MGPQIFRMQAADRLLRIVGHEQIERGLIEDILLRLQCVDHLSDKIVQVLQPEGGGNQIAKENLRDPEHCLRHVLRVPGA